MSTSLSVQQHAPEIKIDEEIGDVAPPKLPSADNATGDDATRGKAFCYLLSKCWSDLTCRHMGLLRWLLAFFIFINLSWVCFFTTTSAHTDIARENVYSQLESEYFEDKAGARVFTYLGVFYLVAGTVSLIALSAGVNLPGPSHVLVRSVRLPLVGGYWTTLDLCSLGLFFAVVAVTIATRVVKKFNEYYDWPADKLWYEVCKTIGKTAAFTLMLLFFPVCKSCFWWDLFNYKFERVIKFHRLLAWFFVLVVAVHAATGVVSLALAGQLSTCLWPSSSCRKPGVTFERHNISRLLTYGWVATVVILPLVITSLPWFRRHKFEWFYYTHFLFVPAVVLMHLHYPGLIYYMAPALAAYILDKVLWLLISHFGESKIVSLTTPVHGFVRMTVSIDPKYSFEPGQWVQIKVPSVSVFEWHPMSVASAPGHSTITFDIKVLGDWTRGLERLALAYDPSKDAHTCIFLDRFHGSSHMKMQGYLTHPAVLMFAGGIGITPMLSSLRSLIEDGAAFPHIRRAVLIWVVKKESVVKLYQEELGRIQSLARASTGCEVEVLVYATLSEKEDTTELVSVDIGHPGSVDIPAGGRPPLFRERLSGYSAMLVLTMGAGSGFYLGLFLANFIAEYLGSSPYEWEILLRLGLATSVAASFVLVGSAGLLLRSSHREEKVLDSSHREEKILDSTSRRGEAAAGQNICIAQLSGSLSSKKSGHPGDNSHKVRVVDHRENTELRVILGCRPNVEGIATDMKKWCTANNCFSVGVSVCGPEGLVQEVVSTCKHVSYPLVHFVMDDETFDW